MELNDATKMWLREQLWKAYYDARKHKHKTRDEMAFSTFSEQNIGLLKQEIEDGTYAPSRSIAFVTHSPVDREIFAAPFRDRVVQHLLYNMDAEWWDEHFIDHSFSCRKGKGTRYGIMACQDDMRKASRGGREEAFIFKFDIQGYFMSLSRKELLKRVCWGLKQIYPGGGYKAKIMRFLWTQVIMDNPVIGAKKRPPYSDWNVLPDAKSLFRQPEGKGIVIGNLTSQLLSNIYLSLLDDFVTKTLGYKYYGRYVDDFYFIVPKTQYKQALKDVEIIESFLKSIGLVLHPKKRYIQPVKCGMEFLGMRIYLHGYTPGKRFIKSFYRGVEEIANGRRDADELASYLGYLLGAQADKLCKKVFESVGWKYNA